MKRAEIEQKISDHILSRCEIKNGDTFLPECHLSIVSSELTDLFIQLSEERMKEQKQICYDIYVTLSGIGYYEEDVAKLILNAPLPKIL